MVTKWEGRLHTGLWLALNLRTMLSTERQLDAVGTADLWILPASE